MSEYLSMPLLGYDLKARTKNFIVWTIISVCLFILIVVMFTNLLNAGLPEFVSDMLSSVPTSVSGDDQLV